MDLAKSFVLTPLASIEQDTPEIAQVEQTAVARGPARRRRLGRLTDLEGSWQGSGFNVIWRPSSSTGHFLELNLTEETLDFDQVPGQIVNRGLLQKDIIMFGLNYLQQISDKNLNAGLHFEPGLWAHVPATQNPREGTSIVRMATIPHGTALVAQGNSSSRDVSERPDIPTADITPFTIGHPEQLVPFPEQDLSAKVRTRTSGAGLTGITQSMLNDPNSVLRQALVRQNITSTTRLQVSSATPDIVGGGVANTAFLVGDSAPNAVAAKVTSTFWLEQLDGEDQASQLQYTQNVLLDFNGLSWPHITVATLRRVR